MADGWPVLQCTGSIAGTVLVCFGRQEGHSYRGIRHVALAPGEVLQSFRPATHGALELNKRVAAGTLLAMGECDVVDAFADLPAQIGELLL
jgi:hypothetical protein